MQGKTLKNKLYKTFSISKNVRKMMVDKINNLKRGVFTIGIYFILSSPLTALASGSNKIATILEKVTDLITGDIGSGLCTLAIIGIGFGWLKLGKIEKEHAIASLLGIGVVYSASYIYGQFHI